jgi:hypothetical protein
MPPTRRAAREAAVTWRPPRALKLIAALWRRLTRDLVDRYRPERHYMRGPGPKSLARNSQAAG